MKQSRNEIKEKIRDDRVKYGVWFPFTNNSLKISLENIGRPIAFSIRAFPLMRQKIGSKSYEWWMLIGGFIWYRLWVAILHDNGAAFYNPLIFGSADANILNIASLIFFVFGFYYKFHNWVQFSLFDKDIDQRSRGKSLLFFFEVDGEHFVNKPLFQQVFIEPLTVGFIGVILIFNNLSIPFGIFLVIGAFFYALDEYFYHMAKEEKIVKQRTSIRSGKKTVEKHDQLDAKNDEDDIYSFN